MSDQNLHHTNNRTRSGKVKWFNNQKGYGFIVCDGLSDIFVHHTAIKMEGYRTLKQGAEVTFDLVETEKGYQALNVVPAKERSSSNPAA